MAVNGGIAFDGARIKVRILSDFKGLYIQSILLALPLGFDKLVYIPNWFSREPL
jgi:hypothetical protein